MLTAWGKRVVSIAKLYNYYGIPDVSLSAASPAFIEAKTISGTTRYIPGVYYANPTFSPITSLLVESGNNCSIGVAFGSDGTIPSENNYTLGSQIVGITGNAPSIVTVFDNINYKYVARIDYTISNDTGAAVTIAEIGLFELFGTSTTIGDAAITIPSGRFSFLIDRTVLDTPIIIADGEAAVVRYEFVY